MNEHIKSHSIGSVFYNINVRAIILVYVQKYIKDVNSH